MKVVVVNCRSGRWCSTGSTEARAACVPGRAFRRAGADQVAFHARQLAQDDDHQPPGLVACALRFLDSWLDWWRWRLGCGGGGGSSGATTSKSGGLPLNDRQSNRPCESGVCHWRDRSAPLLHRPNVSGRPHPRQFGELPFAQALRFSHAAIAAARRFRSRLIALLPRP